MKKVLTSIIAVMYLVMVTGISMELHYCMGKLAGVDFYHNEEDERCGRCGMTEKNTGCCHDEQDFVKLEDSHKWTQNNFNFETPVMITTPVQFFGIDHPLQDIEPVIPIDFSPPDDTGPSACVLNCVFRI